jgi:chitin disaccharide deacetylase
MNTLQDGVKYLIFAADDFGRCVSVNEAVIEAHDRGLLTATSIMAGGAAFDQAVEYIRDRKSLSIGLHVTLCDGKAVLPHSDIPDLTAADGSFACGPAAVWIGLGRRKIMEQAEREIEAQFDRLEAAGISPCYVDGHHHLHMHPGLFGAVCRKAAARGVSWIRLTHEPARVVYGLAAGGRGVISFIEHAVFRALKPSNSRKAGMTGLRCAANVYGLAHSGLLDEGYLLALIDSIATDGKAWVNEIFFHPDRGTEAGMRELGALESDVVAARLDSFGIKRLGYKDMC